MLQLNNTFCILEVHCDFLLMTELVNITHLKQVTLCSCHMG